MNHKPDRPATEVHNTPPRSRSIFFWLGLGGVLLAALGLRAWLLNSFPLSPDEGIHLIWLRLLAAGYKPYTEVYITYPPLYPLAIQAVWQLWPTEAAQRWFSVACTLFGAVGIALLGRKLAGPLAGIMAAALTLFSPPLVEPSVAVLGEFPSVAWSVWAIWLAWLYREAGRGRRLLLVLSGLCLSASLLTKLLSPFVGVLILLMLAGRWYRLDVQNRRLQPTGTGPLKPLLTDVMGWGLALVLPLAVLLPVYDLGPLFGQVIDQRLQARAAYTADESFWPPRYERGVMFGQEDTALVVLGLIGLGLVWFRRPKDGWILPVWLALALTMLAVHNPIRYKHFLILIPPLAILGGAAAAYWIDQVKAWLSALKSSTGQRPSTGVALGGLVLLLALYAWQIPATLDLWQAKAAEPQPPPDEAEALAFIEAVTAPTDCLISDDMQLLYWSGRLAPPELAEVSTNRLKSGALTLAQLIEISDRYDCQLVAAVSNRIPKYLPGYMDWVKRKYLGRFHYGEDDLFFAKADTDPRPATPLRADFGGQFIFHGYTLPPDPVSPGSRLPLTLVWQAQTAPPADYAVFVQLRDRSNTILAGADHQPYQGRVPTSSWPAGAVIQETVWLALPADLPPGQYPLYVGLYDPGTLARLPLADDTSGENALMLGPAVVR
ncbi:MAG: glycosyltransferase family 39 protein [Chloroflexota bacterium]